jgi:hypothetical protein
VLLASHESASASGSYELLGRYTASGQGAVFYSEGGRFYGVSRHPDLDAALAQWASCGYAAQPPLTGPRRSAALTTSPTLPAHTVAPQPAAAAAVSTPSPSTTRAVPPF